MDNIALAFSGGGFRAACFSLGSLSYLRHVPFGPQGRPLLEKVSFISSTSGGSITNLAYSVSVFKGEPFDDFYRTLRHLLMGDQLLNLATRALNTHSEWKGRDAKTRNLINAFSLVYDSWFEAATFSLFSDRSHNPHLEEICINATELTNGLPFRFQSQFPDRPQFNGNIGNHYIHFDRVETAAGAKQAGIAGKIKLADILACSSCFPSGFEPVIFPEDFAYYGLSVEDLRNALQYTANADAPTDAHPAHPDARALPTDAPTPTPRPRSGNPDLIHDPRFNEKLHVGIMDGGIDDNQAIDAFEKACDRRAKTGRPPFDLFISCDAGSNFIDSYTLPLQKRKGLYAVPAWVYLGVGLAVWLLLAAFLPYRLITRRGAWTTERLILSAISAVFDLPLLLLLYGAMRRLFKKRRRTSWSKMLRRYGRRFLRLRLGALLQMLAARFKSVFLLANDIYMKQIRRMYYHDLFQADARFKGMIIQNAIYDCSKVRFGTPPPPSGLQPSPDMIAIAETARLMGTTLWFDAADVADQTMKKLILTGQFTTCYNLIRYLDALPPAGMTPDLQKLRAVLQADWDRFCEKPDFLY